MTIREKKFVEAKIQGKNNTQAAMIATGTTSKDVAKTQGHRLSTSVNVQNEMQRILSKFDITMHKAIRPIADALEANKMATDKDSGEIYDSGIPDHTTRLKGSDRALALLGMAKEAAEEATTPMDNKELLEALRNGDNVALERIVFSKAE